ncbi:MAG: TonB-dependent receptor [Chitinophagales bacterium]|nr:TonB-dependent receptor [Chitinophagales bacterium]
MKHRLPLLLFMLCCVLFIQAQVVISGVVSDSLGKKPMDAASVLLLKTGAADALQTALTDDKGRFNFTPVPVGNYQVKVTYTGYTAKTLPVEVKPAQASPIQLTVELQPSGGQLQAVEILSEKPVIRNQAGKIIFDVAKTVTDGAETAQDALQKIPGVNVGQDGAVSVRGKGNVRILVDGKSNPMAQSNPEQFLKSIPAKNIESIEVNTAPSAKYDAAGSGIVINIKLKKGKLEGTNGSIAAGVGTVFNKFNGSGNINYKKGKINVFGNAAYNDEKKWTRSTDDTKIISAAPVYFSQLVTGKGHSQNGNGKAGFEYAIDSLHAITYTLDGSYFSWKQNQTGTGTVRDAENNIMRTTAPGNTSSNSNLSFTNAINYRQTFDTTDRAWTIDIAHTYDKHDNNGYNYSHAYDTSGTEMGAAYFSKQTFNEGLTHGLLLQSDFNTPFKKVPDAKLEVGVKEELNIFTSNTRVNDLSTGSSVPDTLQSNRFNYMESITAAYGSFSGKYKKFNYSGGLRWEHTYVTSPLSGVRQNYSSFFPTASVGVSINDNHTLTLNYGRNINRPGFWMLNNAVQYQNAYTVNAGNPRLRPAFSNWLSLDYNATIKDQSLNFSASFSRTPGTFQEITTVDSNNVTRSRTENAGVESNLYIGVDGTFKIGKHFDFNISPGYGRTWYSYLYNNQRLTAQRNIGYLWGSATVKFWKNASIQLWGWFNTGGYGAQSTGKPVGSLTIAIKKKFFKDHLVVQLSCRDIFNTITWRNQTSNPALESRTLWKNESRIGYLTLTYQFGKQSFSAQNKTKGKSSRIGGGGGGNQ